MFVMLTPLDGVVSDVGSFCWHLEHATESKNVETRDFKITKKNRFFEKHLQCIFFNFSISVNVNQYYIALQLSAVASEQGERAVAEHGRMRCKKKDVKQ